MEYLGRVRDTSISWLESNPMEKAYFLDWLTIHPAAKAYLEILISIGALQFSSILSLILSTEQDEALKSATQWSTCHPQACHIIQEWAYASGHSQLSPEQARILILSIISDEIECCWLDWDVNLEGVPISRHQQST